jgi:iron(III) transport system permease protein
VVVFLAVAYLVVLPLGMLLYASFGEDRNALPFEQREFGFDTYVAVLTEGATVSLLWNTLAFTAGSLTLGVGVAVGLGWLVERTDLPMRNLVRFLVIVPMAVPSMIYAISWSTLASPRQGLLNVVVRGLSGSDAETGPFNVYSIWGMIFVQGIAIVPFAYLMIAGTFAMVDPTFEQAARVAGASFGRTARRITAPLMVPALLGAVIYYAIWVIETFEIPTTLGLTAGRTVVSTQIYFAAHPQGGGLPDYALASVLSVLLLVVALALLAGYQRVTRRAEKYVTVTGKAWRPIRVPLGRSKWPAVALCGGYVGVAVLLPIAMMVWSSLFVYYRSPSREAVSAASLDTFRTLVDYPGIVGTLRNTVVMAVVASLLTIGLCLLISWLVVRPPVGRRWVRALDTASFLPLTIPALVVGLALIFGYIRTPIYGTVAILVLALVTKFIAYGSRTLIAAQLQISPELEDQASVSGAGRFRVLRAVLLPLLAPAVVNLAFWAAIVSVRELAMVLMLYSPANRVLSTLLWGFWQRGDIGYASAIGVATFGLLGVLYFSALGLSKRYRSRIGGGV